jgi:hypothetical protein
VTSRPNRSRTPWQRVFGLDLVLLHAPSVWDFRNEVILQGPIADVIPSTDEFEMYPIGLTSIAAYLEANHYNTRMVNLAYRVPGNAWETRVYGKCHRKHTAAVPWGLSLRAEVRVKRCGKSAPRGWQQPWQGKPHSEQDQIGGRAAARRPHASAWPPGRSQERLGDESPRGMIAHDRTRLIDPLGYSPFSPKPRDGTMRLRKRGTNGPVAEGGRRLRCPNGRKRRSRASTGGENAFKSINI